MRAPLSLSALLALLLPALVLWGGCKRTKYICPAYQSAFVLDAPAYKRNAKEDSLAATADTSADANIIMTLAERVKKDPASPYEFDEDSTPKFPDNLVVKTDVLLIRKISRRRKDKVMASVPMITIFPESTDSTQNGEEEGVQKSNAVPAADPEENATEPEPQKEAPKKEEEDAKPF